MGKKEGKKDFIRQIIAGDLAKGKHETTITRFPPEPNGFLHIGHARAICLNFGLAQENPGARCHLRFDDTNPVKEDTKYVEAIQEDIKWLGYDWGEHLYFASDYFDYFYDCAVQLIKDGKAYVDLQSPEEMKAGRGNVKEAGTNSPYRDTSVEENLELFEKMKNGEIGEGKAVLRAKIDMESPNMNMRDPALYRILHAHHHRTGDKWKIYPMYDFAHPLEDAKECITHSLCSLEFEDHRPLYDWVVQNCPTPSEPRQIEFSRLNLTYTVMSKRKLLDLVNEGIVAGWDDPRMPTLSGMRRRGYAPESIRTFIEGRGITKFNSNTDFALLEADVRAHLNANADRRMAVLEPLKLVIDNWEEGRVEEMECMNNPENPEAGTRKVPLGKEVYIERDDFMEEAPKKYFRLAPGQAIRLRGGYILNYVSHEKDPETGEVTQVHVEYIPGTIGQNAPEGIKCKAAVHWVSVDHAVDAEIRLYDRLFTEENPDGFEGGFMKCLNPESLNVIKGAKVEPILAEAGKEYSCQFERVGYFCTDKEDHEQGEKIVFNRTVELKAAKF
ncbi:glutaminyl-tRNA synthetase [Rubritalea squalenifaciens DSM 18772]|uniref:Glutamine--tRNA ligase n=1 Tax=Rubritalea squalenifaciens DSM 18772 TaxID=1123071 RepID=A0A1M6PUA7_9BACT|nr:glutamine--tRNA ligase/YqeY domain fusion protein [Rubritalea squalenifaciens]SHK11496.1 glutaminyl-tRNA synthetase [Rubritalea squalenifaciens DSM 18772]